MYFNYHICNGTEVLWAQEDREDDTEQVGPFVLKYVSMNT